MDVLFVHCSLDHNLYLKTCINALEPGISGVFKRLDDDEWENITIPS